VSRRLVQSLAIAALFAVVCGAVSVWALAERYVRPGPSSADIQLVVPRGAGADDIARLLVERGVLASPWAFLAGTRWDGTLPRFKAGEYLFAVGISARAAGDLLASGRTVQRRITFAEGLMSAQIVELLRSAEGFEGALDGVPPEGSLLPETYFYSWGEPRARTIERAQRAMRETLAELWERRAPDLPLTTPAEAVVLASSAGAWRPCSSTVCGARCACRPTRPSPTACRRAYRSAAR
jgi:UPF0755 protein